LSFDYARFARSAQDDEVRTLERNFVFELLA